MNLKNVFAGLMIIAATLLLSGCDFTDLPESDDSTGELELILDPVSGTDEVSYHIEVDINGSAESVYWQISTTSDYDEDEWQEATTCWFLCDYVIDVEDVEDGDYYVHFKVDTKDGTEYLMSDDTYNILNPTSSIDIVLDPSEGLGDASYHVEIDIPNENVGTIEDVYWQLTQSTDYVESQWKEATTCWFLCDYVIDIESEGAGEYNIIFKIVTSTTTKYIISDNTYLFYQDEYTVSYDTNGGEPISDVSVGYGGTVYEPISPLKKGYNFVEWQLNGNTISFPYILEEDVTMVAVYEKMSTLELLFDYHKNYHSFLNAHDRVDEHIDIYTGNDSIEIEYYSSGQYYIYYYGEDHFDVISIITIDIVNSTIRYEEDGNWFYERDLVHSYYEGNVPDLMASKIETEFNNILNDFLGTILQQRLLEVYGEAVDFSDFNPNWDQLDILPESEYNREENEFNRYIIFDILGNELAQTGDYINFYFSITNNTNATITTLILDVCFSVEHSDGSIYYHSDTLYLNGTLEMGETLNGSIITPIEYWTHIDYNVYNLIYE